MLSMMVPTNAFGGFPFYLTDDDGLELLKGEKQFSLFFTYLKDADEDLKTQIKEDMTLKLQNIGIEPNDWEIGISYIQVEVAAIKKENVYYSGYIRITFNKKAEFFKTLDDFLERGTVIHTYSVVWNEEIIFINANAVKIIQYYKDLFDKFLSDYLKANPRTVKIEEHTSERKLLNLFKDEKSKESQP
jgi:hypothetical protein